MNFLTMQQLVTLYNKVHKTTLNRQYFASVGGGLEQYGAFKVGDGRGCKWLITENGAKQVIKNYLPSRPGRPSKQLKEV